MGAKHLALYLYYNTRKRLSQATGTTEAKCTKYDKFTRSAKSRFPVREPESRTRPFSAELCFQIFFCGVIAQTRPSGQKVIPTGTENGRR